MRRRGFTLIEVIIAAAIALVILGAVYRLFTAGARAYTRAQARSDLQATGVSAMHRLVHELRGTAIATVTLETSHTQRTDAISFRTEDPDVSGSITFTPARWFVVYYLDAASHSLVRKTWPHGPADVSFDPDPLTLERRLKAEELQTICARPNGTEQALASFVVELTTTPPVFPILQPITRFSIDLRLEQPVASDQVMSISVSDTVTPRNSL